MSFSLDIGWNWKAFGILVGYEKDTQFNWGKTLYIQILFLSVAINWGR